MPKSPEEMAQAMMKNLKEKTGKTMPQWLKIAKASKLEKHGQIVKHLKEEHGMTHGFAGLVATTYLQGDKPTASGDDLIESQYAGPKADLKPIYDALMAKITKFGKDVEVAPKKAYVSLRRNKQFALIKPSTKTRVDVGINLKGQKPSGRLEESGNAMISHNVKVESKKDVNAELINWLKEAYENS